MHVLLVGPTPRVFSAGNFQWFSDTARALRRLGHTTTLFPCPETWTASPAVTQRLEQRLLPLAGWLARYQEALFRRRDRRLIRLARRLRPDLVLVLKGETLSGEVLAEVKRLAHGPLVTWWVDDPWRFPSSLERFALFDHVFVFDRSYVLRLEALGAKRVHFLPCACDETVYRPMRLTRGDQRDLGSDVAFVAWSYPEREAVVRALARAVDIGVWGGGWRNLETLRTGRGTPVVRGSAVSTLTAARIYNASRIGLNAHASQTRLGGLNTRAFELLASGLFQLVDRVAGIEQLLTPDVEVVCYSSPDEARQLAKHYLADGEMRLRIATKGRARVLEEHTYVCRMRTLCHAARETTSQRATGGEGTR